MASNKHPPQRVHPEFLRIIRETQRETGKTSAEITRELARILRQV